LISSPTLKSDVSDSEPNCGFTKLLLAGTQFGYERAFSKRQKKLKHWFYQNMDFFKYHELNQRDRITD